MAAIMKHTTLADWIRTDEQKEADKTEVLMDHEVRHDGRIYHKITYVGAQTGSLAQHLPPWSAPTPPPTTEESRFRAPRPFAPYELHTVTHAHTHTRTRAHTHMNTHFVSCAGPSSCDILTSTRRLFAPLFLVLLRSSTGVPPAVSPRRTTSTPSSAPVCSAGCGSISPGLRSTF